MGGPGAALVAMDLKQVVISVSKDWRQISGDSNLFDVLFQAHRIVKALAIAVPSDVPAKDIGVRLVEFTTGCLWRVGCGDSSERAHNPKVAGSNPAPATTKSRASGTSPEALGAFCPCSQVS